MHVNVYVHNVTKCAPPHTQLVFKLPMGVCSVAKSCPALCDPMDCSPPGSSVHGVSQARIPETVAISSSMGSFRPRDRGCHFLLQGVFPTQGSNRPLQHWWAGSLSLSHLRPKPKTQNNDFQFCPFSGTQD